MNALIVIGALRKAPLRPGAFKLEAPNLLIGCPAASIKAEGARLLSTHVAASGALSADAVPAVTLRQSIYACSGGTCGPLLVTSKPAACAEGTTFVNSTLLIGLIVLAVILAGAFAGMKVRAHLPAHHLTDETKNLVSVSTAVVATVSALVLGLLISNANSKFTRLGGETTSLSAQLLRLDHLL